MCAARENYDPAIARLGKDNRISKMRGMEHVCKAGTDNKNRIRAVEVGAHNLIIANVKAMWIQELRHPYTFFTAVPPRDLLNDLAKFSTGLDCPAGVELILSLHKIWDSDPASINSSSTWRTPKINRTAKTFQSTKKCSLLSQHTCC